VHRRRLRERALRAPQTPEFEDLFEAGVIDPTKVVRSALQNAASVGSLLITTGGMM